ncbi:hypothetical protein E0H22_20425 [Rhodopseudomonas boonkerdii]|uniref:hypothetical protein n=1 Tax=Rhodopseudomonas boonkerdii TaxID=475937 RepID=UPI000BD744AA|nr:hypothetical protein [Rhodopseudomonas boonkerdii]OYU91685.1 MAG: hypothetical protein CFE29_02075 [Bradyrhizobiaceae bacterium PARB1]UGV27833.1 hypothetical protein E0H22_20425 [Rhodopseudomonas boonkerdii]
MPSRAPHLPHYVERTALQKLRAAPDLPATHLLPAGQKTLANMLQKGWIESSAGSMPRYRITPEGETALKAEIPMPRSTQTRTR